MASALEMAVAVADFSWDGVMASAGFVKTTEDVAGCIIVPILCFVSTRGKDEVQVRIPMSKFPCTDNSLTSLDVRRRVDLGGPFALQQYIDFEVWCPLSLTVKFWDLSGDLTLVECKTEVTQLTLAQVLARADSIELSKDGAQLNCVDQSGARLDMNTLCWPRAENSALTDAFHARWPSSSPGRYKTLSVNIFFAMKTLRVVPYVGFDYEVRSQSVRLEDFALDIEWTRRGQRTFLREVLPAWTQALIERCKTATEGEALRYRAFAHVLTRVKRASKMKDVFLNVDTGKFCTHECAERCMTFILVNDAKPTAVRFNDLAGTRIHTPTQVDLEVMRAKMRRWFTLANP